jgi:hypothetical protein
VEGLEGTQNNLGTAAFEDIDAFEPAGNAAAISESAADTAVSDHVALPDPHSQYAELSGGTDANFTAMPQVGGDPIVEPATTSKIGTVEKATTTEAKAGTADKFPDAAGVHAAFNQYGLGIDGSAVKVRPTDLDLVDISGFYPVEGNTINSPPDAGAGLLKVFSWEGQSTIKIQEYTELHKSKVWFRKRLQASGYTDWQEIYHTGMTPNFPNMPQVGGNPIVESGSNTNGEYTKFADGTLQMWSYKSLSSGETVPAGGFQPALGQASLEHTACVSSVGELLVLTEPRSGGYSNTEDMSSVVIGRNANNGLTSYRLYSVTGIRVAYTRGISFYAIGRWF